MGLAYLARHGQDHDNHAGLLNGRRNTPLTALGRFQAGEMSEKLEGLGIKYILTSPLERARQTARISAKLLGIPNKYVIEHPSLIERCFGVLTGKPIAEAINSCQDILCTEHTKYLLDIPGAEPFDNVYRRAMEVVNQLSYIEQDTNVLIVCHGDVGNMVKAVMYDMTWRKALSEHGRFMNCDVFELHPEFFGGRLL